MKDDAASRHTCPGLATALADGFVRREGERLLLADLTTSGSAGSPSASLLYGPQLSFCPFCGAALSDATT